MLFFTSQLLAVVIWFSTLLLLCAQAEPWYGAFVLAILIIFPHAMSHALLFWATSLRARLVLLVGMLLFAGWFLYVYANVFYWNLDPQSPIALLFIGIYALPVMIPIWILARLFERWHRSSQVIA